MLTIQDDPSTVQSTLAELKKTFGTHKTRSLKFRRQQLENLLRGVKELENQFHDALNKDLGASKFYSEAFSTIITQIEIKDSLKNFERWARPRQQDTTLLAGPAKSYIVPEPLGVVLVMAAWNYPLYTAVPPAAQAIAAGNCVVLKPSEMAPHTSNVLRTLFEKYLDPSCYRCIEGGALVATEATQQPFDLIIFTGSPQKGRIVAQAAAKNLTPCLLELGGKSPTIVDKDVDMENALLRIAQGRFLNAGQTCVACDYVFVHKAVATQFVARLKDTIETFFTKDASKSPDNIRIINKAHTERLASYLQEKHGGQVVYGGNFDIEQRYVAPTIVVEPSTDSRMMQDEIFGPILPVYTWENLDDVIKFINDRPKPLALYYFGSNDKNFERIENETSSGALAKNEACFHTLNPHLPFGGVGNSGMGAYHGEFGFTNCSHMKPVFRKATINSFPLSTRFPPYTDFKQKVLKFLFQNSVLEQSKALKAVSYVSVLAASIVLYRKGKLDGVINQVKPLLGEAFKKLPRL